jgi:hypothetical protein
MSETTNMSGKEYEILTQAIYQAILRSEGVETINVLHNVDISGKSGCKHQIDVYWEFRLGGVTFKTAIECKRYADPLEIGRVRDFYAVLADVGNTQGIIVTTTGYQSGAKQFAEFYGINLRELRTPSVKDWHGKIKNVHINFEVVTPNIIGADIKVDPTWLAAQTSLDPSNFTIKQSGMSDEIGLFDANGTLVRSFTEIQDALPALEMAKANESADKTYKFSVDVNGMYVRAETLGLVPLSEMTIIWQIYRYSDLIRIQGEEFVKFILTNLKDGSVHKFKADGNAIEVI